jgi:nucleoside-diphosphate-sugar epimerase
VESAPAGSRFHGAGEEGIPFKNIAEAIGLRLNLPVSSISPESAEEHFAWLTPFVLMDNPASSALTRKTLGWEPAGPTLITDIVGK